MKKLIMLSLAALGLAVLLSEDIRRKVLRSASVLASGAERLVLRGDHLETRVVDGDNYDSVTKVPGRLVIIVFHHERTSVARAQSASFDAKVRHLPAKVLLGKVQAEKSEALLERLGVEKLPAIKVYREGRLRREYQAPIDEDAFIADVEYMLEHWAD